MDNNRLYEYQMFHAFIIKLFAHIKPSLFIATENRATTSRQIWSPSGLQISAFSHSRARPTCQYAEFNSSLTFWRVSMTVSRRQLSSSFSSSSSYSSLDSPKLSGNEVGLRDDALHFVICGVRCCLVVTDRHFMSVSLKKDREKDRLTSSK